MPLFDVAILRTVDKAKKKQELEVSFRLVADDSTNARDRAIIRAKVTEEDLGNLEILVRPFVQ